MGIIMVSGSIIAPPDGVDLSSTESLKDSMHLFAPRHFIMPFLAHALGTLTGAIVAALIATNRKMSFAFIIGGFFLIGGIANIMMLPSPLWFTITDLLLAYFLMAWIGGKIVTKGKTRVK
jgi:hypothetical protein